jgi:hypothetical protein
VQGIAGVETDAGLAHDEWVGGEPIIGKRVVDDQHRVSFVQSAISRGVSSRRGPTTDLKY